MQISSYRRVLQNASTDEAIENSVAYLTEQMKRIVLPSEKVLICFPHRENVEFGTMVGKAIEACGGEPIFWDEDLRWKTLLMLAFRSRATIIVAPPMIVLGLSKISKHKGIPLSIRKTVLSGYTCQDWMVDGIVAGLDCTIDGCFSPGAGAIVAGFSCQGGRGIHIRSQEYGVEIVSQDGESVSNGTQGEIVFFAQSEPDAKLHLNSVACLQTAPCRCGSCEPKLTDIDFSSLFFMPADKIGESLLQWSSILDCRVEMTEYGLELEVVVFPGEKLPKLPSCAKLIVRPWNPEKDIPISLSDTWFKPNFSEQMH